MRSEGPLRFPPGFLWGSAVSAHQTEGGNANSDWWAHELARGTTAHEPSGAACDSYHRYREDWGLAASSGQNAVRFSIEWARIEPAPGVFSTEALDHYRDVIGTARDLGLTPMVTLHHFTNPLWFAERGGWTSDDAPDVFGQYARAASVALGDLWSMACTINEPSVVSIVGHLMGYFPPQGTDLVTAHVVAANLLRAHAAAADAVRRSGAPAGPALSVNEFGAADSSPEAKRSRDYLRHWWVGMWIDALRTGRVTGLEIPDRQLPGLAGSSDFVGIQYYTGMVVGRGAEGAARAALPVSRPDRDVPDAVRSPARRTQMAWAWYPDGLGLLLDDVATIGIPIYVTENGIATADDDERIEFTALHLERIHAAIARGRDVGGYFYWSLLDNFEWNEGYRPTFGLVAVDRKTMQRTPKPSLTWYGGVARANALH
ncbi:MAG: glycoside hydrolase family 1 protein [Actinobacteria bacterium]|nr:MAG: glycoside hydrolase family 1 protein [Actinomycetota bacterium]